MIPPCREEQYNRLCAMAGDCRLCARMVHRAPVLNHHNGPLHARVMFVAEAPGRLGADRTSVPLHGDTTGDNFERLLGTIEWDRSQVFVTNAVLCNPRTDVGTNDTPTLGEVRNCADFLAATINVVQPTVVVALGAVALRALAEVQDHPLTLRDHVGALVPWAGRWLFPLYHPGGRAQVHRPFAKQVRDFYKLAKLFDMNRGELRAPRRKPPTRPLAGLFMPTKMQVVLSYIVARLGRVSRFRLAKLLYLVDYTWLRGHGELLTEGFYISQAHGPVATTLSERIAELVSQELGQEWSGGEAFYSPGPAPRLDFRLPTEEESAVEQVLECYGALDEGALKARVYLTLPMKAILRMERAGQRTRNVPVFGALGASREQR